MLKLKTAAAILVLFMTNFCQAGKATEDSIYHFIRFNVGNVSKYEAFLTKLEQNVKNNKGEILTRGLQRSSSCLENTCRDVNIVIRFPNKKRANKSFKKIKPQIPIAAFSDLSYSSSVQLVLPLFDFDAQENHFFIGELNVANITAFRNHYETKTAQLVAFHGGTTSTVDKSSKCLLGNCYSANILISFPTIQQAHNWYYSPEYQQLIPIRQSLSQGRSLVLTE